MNGSWSLSTESNEMSNSSIPYWLSSTASNQVEPKVLKPHSRNCSIYGSDEDVTELVVLIAQSGWVKPLVVTPNYVIISGHRRWKAALELQLENLPVEVKEFPNEIAELEALLLENASRFKTTEQKVREAEAWKEVERTKAKDRQGTRTDIRENFPGCDSECDSGRVRDFVARRVGLGSGRTYEKAAKVVTQLDEEGNQGHLEIAQVLRKVLNEQSIDAAHTLILKTPQERLAIAQLIIRGEAKSVKQAEKMVKQSNNEDFNDPLSATYGGFKVGDWVEVNNATVSSNPYIGQSGRVEQIWPVEKQISVNFEDGSTKIRFYPHELTLIARATPPCPYSVGNLVAVDIDRHEAASGQEKKWNGCWGKVTQIGEMGSVSLDIGKESLQLFPRDLKSIDAPGTDLRKVVERVLRLRRLELDEVEHILLDAIQRREWFTPRQLDYLDFMDSFYLQTNNESGFCNPSVEARQALSL